MCYNLPFRTEVAVTDIKNSLSVLLSVKKLYLSLDDLNKFTKSEIFRYSRFVAVAVAQYYSARGPWFDSQQWNIP